MKADALIHKLRYEPPAAYRLKQLEDSLYDLHMIITRLKKQRDHARAMVKEAVELTPSDENPPLPEVFEAWIALWNKEEKEEA